MQVDMSLIENRLTVELSQSTILTFDDAQMLVNHLLQIFHYNYEYVGNLIKEKPLRNLQEISLAYMLFDEIIRTKQN